jgi:hypothetical protein
MLESILQDFRSNGYSVEPQKTLFIDDDHRGHYRPRMAEIGVIFLQKGVDLLDFNELLKHPRFML